MRQRLTVVILAVVAGALVVAGMGSLVLVHRADADQTRAQLVQQAEAIASQADEAQRPAVLALVQKAARLYSSAIIGVRSDGTVVRSGSGGAGAAGALLPAGLTAADLHTARLLDLKVVSAVKGSLAYAAVPVVLSAADLSRARRSASPAARALARAQANGLQLVEVATRQVPGLAAGALWFTLAGAGALLVAGLASLRLGRRIARPLAEVEAAARRVASGDLATRLDVEAEEYPELASLGRSINTMTESLARAKGLERQFLLSVSHDLRTPLTSIRGWAEALADGAAQPERAARVILAEADRLQRLVQDLLDLARIDARSFSSNPKQVDVAAVALARAEGFRPACREAGLELVTQPVSEPVWAFVDPDRLGQIVANLVENAYKYAAQRIRVRVAAADEAAAALTVEDDGPGIPPGELDHVFERLYQAEHRPARQAGSGLGLAIVKELSQAMGGGVRIESPLGPAGGTRLVVTLPRHAAGPSWPLAAAGRLR